MYGHPRPISAPWYPAPNSLLSREALGSKALGSTDLPQSENLGGQEHVGKAEGVGKRVRYGSAESRVRPKGSCTVRRGPTEKCFGQPELTRRRSTLPNKERRQRLTHRVVSCTLCRHLNDERDWRRIGSRIRKMITLHAGESNGALVLWGEESRDDGVRPTSRRRRRTNVSHASPHPFAASADGLAGALKETWLGLKTDGKPSLPCNRLAANQG